MQRRDLQKRDNGQRPQYLWIQKCYIQRPHIRQSINLSRSYGNFAILLTKFVFHTDEALSEPLN
jgi:hypothetical protein